MPRINVTPMVPTDNIDILNAIRKNASPEYQRRVPEATQANIQQTLQNLTDYRPTWNEFIDALVNRIGMVLIRNNTWTNPLAKFKSGMLQYGDTIEEINVGLIKAKTYRTDRESLERDIFGHYPPDVQASYHKVNRAEYYPITINEALLKRAFIDANGLQSFITDAVTAPTTSDQWDEFLLTAQLFEEYYKAGGFFNIQVPDISADNSTAEQAKVFLRELRAMAGKLQFMSTHYNASGMPVAVDPEDLELFITPEALAAIDVEALAAAFNIDKANMVGRINIIPSEHFRIPGVQAILTTRYFFVIADVLIETAAVWNPVALTNNQFFHHHEIISASRFAPAVMFSTQPSTIITIETPEITGVGSITVADEDGVTVTDLMRGSIYQIGVEATTSPADGDNNGIRLQVTGNLSSKTYISNQDGTITIASGERSRSIVIEAYAIHTDIPQLVGTATYDIVGARLDLWPDPKVLDDDDTDGDLEVIPEDIEADDDDIVIVPNVEGVDYRKAITTGITFTDAGDLVTIPSHGAGINDRVVFGTITSTTGVSAATNYYVKSVVNANQITISATPGGSTLALTTNGSAASATLDLRPGSEHTVVSSTTFTAVAKSGYEIAVGATTSWVITP